MTIKYAGVPIFAMIPFRKNRETEIRQCVGGRSNVYLVETGNWAITYTDGTHPDLNGGVVAGQKLAEFIVSVVGKQFFI
ncbi:hypothetical protein [Aerococcus sp. 1KP-2016]|uniref:hypothetical protein n=1 Tax=Aerococcus sp. 1KP-2016 TaxID=1981982 RepID=UPI000B984E67|nr:hypothetical protein [Aerococcus sp. 1KP-2016]OYQ67919.1 hypothetical protein B9P78_02125 [Aerococcus sp. 1KP-2016]